MSKKTHLQNIDLFLIGILSISFLICSKITLLINIYGRLLNTLSPLLSGELKEISVEGI